LSIPVPVITTGVEWVWAMISLPNAIMISLVLPVSHIVYGSLHEIVALSDASQRARTVAYVTVSCLLVFWLIAILVLRLDGNWEIGVPVTLWLGGTAVFTWRYWTIIVPDYKDVGHTHKKKRRVSDG
ncbi:MAG: hypothetical protein AAF125_21910, partial [Chloroflexota bacterium]